MRSLKGTRQRLVALGTILIVAALAQAQYAVPHEPTPDANPETRALRDNYVRSWHLYADTQLDGILNPGDTYAESFNNWWSPASSNAVYDYSDQGRPSGQPWAAMPYNAANSTLPANDPNRLDDSYNYRLSLGDNQFSFFMNYSQYDNTDWETYGDGGLIDNYIADMNRGKNGYSMGWIAGSTENVSGDPGSTIGNINIDVYVHKGRTDDQYSIPGFGTSVSDPMITASNDIGELTEQADPYSNAADSAVLSGNRSAQDIINDGITDHTGSELYSYDDLFVERSTLHDNDNDGGMLAGLSGWSEFNADDANWGDQQVIRIDLASETLQTLVNNGMTEVVFYDFGNSDPSTWGQTGVDQVNPTKIVLNIDLANGFDNGQLYMDLGSGDRLYFPENRIYIAVEDQIPEPATLAIMITGAAVGLLGKRRRTRRS
jgi:hypothetical protein